MLGKWMIYAATGLIGIVAAMSAEAEDLSITKYQLVRQQRVGRTTFDYVFRATATNSSNARLQDVTATLVSLTPAVKVVDGTLTFPRISPLSSGDSIDTFTVRCDRAVTFNSGNVSWTFSATPGVVRGSVKGLMSGASLAGVVVSAGSATAVTDAEGKYSLQVPAGSATLTAEAAGYLKTFRATTVSSATVVTMDWSLSLAYGNQDPPALGMDYIILAWNDLGMHCAQDDYSHFMILPPYNTLHVQVIQRGIGPVTSGINVSYSFAKKTDSSLWSNFWDFAPAYGWTGLAKNVGLTGSGLSGTMQVDPAGLGFVAYGIPLTPYDDDGTSDPYAQAAITVTDSVTGMVLQTATVVAPVSTEMNCSNCHGANAYLDILAKHDSLSGTTLVADRSGGTLHLCAECHADNVLGLAGKPGIKNLSLSMHGFHSSRMATTPVASATDPPCYNCHPGPKTACLRGIMAHAGQTCMSCHGDMTAMTADLVAGRAPWLEEPKCGDCHDATHRENDGTLFRNSRLFNTVDPKMSGQLYCEACHNSTHAEFTSTNAVDNSIPVKFQGDGYWIWNCFVCHTDYMTSPSIHH